jgi:hypothetical protein
VAAVAAELQSRHPEIPSLQAYRYAAGLSQDQAAARYNEVTGHRTSLGGTTINAWETWARQRGAGSPPSFASLLTLSIGYRRGPLGVSEESVSPSDLVAESYERLTPEDQLSLKKWSQDGSSERQARGPVRASQVSVRLPQPPPNVIGADFTVEVPAAADSNPERCLFSLPNPQPGQLVDLTWDAFGLGIERVVKQVKSLGRRLDVDACFGVNEAGLVMATFLASAQFSRCSIGYLRCNKVRDEVALASESWYPDLPEAPTVFVCDFEVKHADVVGLVARSLRARYPRARLYFAAFGAMTRSADLAVTDFDQLTGADNMRKADFDDLFVAATMATPGIEPPLELR